MHIIGASGHAKVICDILELTGEPVSGIWDDNKEVEKFGPYAISGLISEFYSEAQDNTIIAIGNNRIRKTIAENLGTKFGKGIHPNSTIASTAILSQGIVVMANVAVNAACKIGAHVILNTNCSIDHDCIIEDFAHISPQVGLAGNVKVGEGTHIGIGACVIQGIKIGKWATVGAGAVVIRDVPDYAVVVGNPGKIIKYNSEFL